MDDYQKDDLLDGKYTFSDVVDIEQLTAIFKKLTAATGFTIGLADNNTLEVLIKAGWHDICVNFHRADEKSCKVCEKCSKDLFAGLEKEKKVRIVECDHGLYDCVTPVFIENKHIANLTTGQFLMAEPDISKFIQQANKYGFDETEYIKAVKDVPVIARQQVIKVMEYLAEFSVYIAEQGLNNIRITRLNEELVQKEDNLKLFKQSVEQSNEAIYWMDEQAKFVYTNEYATEMLGYSNEEFLKLSVFDIDPEYTYDEWSLNWELLKNNLSERKTKIESIHKTKDGNMINIEIIPNYIKLHDRELMIAHVRDITEHKRIYEALIESEGKARLFIENTPLPVAMFDNNMRYMMVSRQWFNAYRLKEKDIIGKTHYEVFPEIEETWKDDHRRVLNGEIYRNDKDKFIREDGSVQWLRYELRPWYNYSDQIGGLVMFTEDITERVEAEEEFKELASLNQVILDTVSLGLIFVRDQKIIWVNSAILNMFGYSQEELIGQSTSVFYADEENYKDIAVESYKVLAEGGTYYTDSLGKHRNGSIFWCHVVSKAIDPSNIGEGSLWTISDIDEIKQHEEQLRIEKEKAEESEKRLKALHNASFGGIAIHKKGIILDCNKSLSDMTGFSYDELIGMNGLLLIAEDYRDYVMNMIQHGYEKPYEAYGKRKNGKEYPLRLEARIIPYNGENVRSVEFRDITDIKKAQESLQKNQQLLLESQRIAKMGSWELDLGEMKLNWNTEAYNIYEVDTRISSTMEMFNEFVHPDDRSFVNNHLEKTIRNKRFDEFECRIITARGNLKTVLVAGELIFDNNDEPVKAYGIIQDISEKKQAEQALVELNNELESRVRQRTEQLQQANEELKTTLQNLKETQTQLLHSEKMASLGVLTAGVAHEINNPLNFISGAYSGLQDIFENKTFSENYEQVGTLINAIKTGVDRSSAIIKGLNQFSRSSVSHDEDCDIHAIIDNCISILQNQIKHLVVVKKHFYPNNLIVRGNVGNLHQVFINILGNSVQSISSAGRIDIETKVKNKKIIIEITDNGDGIKPENLEKITDPFFTTKAPGQGTGLGLAITYNIIREHKGELKFKSELGKGTTVKIVLPQN